MRILPFVLKLILLLALIAACLWFYSENQRLRGTADVLGKEVAQRGRDLAARGKAADKAKADANEEINQLKKDLLGERMRRDGITKLVGEAAAKQEERLERINRKIVEDQKPMPLGLRRGLIALNECLQGDGYGGMRFMGARGIADRKLLGGEMFEHDRKTMTSGIYIADEVTFELNRVKGTLTMRFLKGHMSVGGLRSALPETGHEIVLREVYGPMWERRLPFLVRAEGEYPEPKSEKPRDGPLDLVSIFNWLGRFEELMANAKTELKYKVDRFRRVENATFKKVLLAGYDKKRNLAMTVEADDLQVVVDKKRGTVELLMRGGTLRKPGGKSSLAEDGYRILLLGVTPKKASDVMLGMVVQQ